MLKYKRTTLPTNPKARVCIDVDGKDIWFECSPEVKSYVSQNIKEGELVEILKESRNGVDFVTRVSRPGSNPPPPQAQPSGASGSGSQPATGAGVAQKTQEAPRSSGYGAKSPEDAKQIRRLSVLSSACNAVTAVQSQLEPNTLPDYVLALYTKLLAEVEK